MYTLNVFDKRKAIGLEIVIDVLVQFDNYIIIIVKMFDVFCCLMCFAICFIIFFIHFKSIFHAFNILALNIQDINF